MQQNKQWSIDQLSRASNGSICWVRVLDIFLIKTWCLIGQQYPWVYMAGPLGLSLRGLIEAHWLYYINNTLGIRNKNTRCHRHIGAKLWKIQCLKECGVWFIGGTRWLQNGRKRTFQANAHEYNTVIHPYWCDADHGKIPWSPACSWYSSSLSLLVRTRTTVRRALDFHFYIRSSCPFRTLTPITPTQKHEPILSHSDLSQRVWTCSILLVPELKGKWSGLYTLVMRCLTGWLHA